MPLPRTSPLRRPDPSPKARPLATDLYPPDAVQSHYDGERPPLETRHAGPLDSGQVAGHAGFMHAISRTRWRENGNDAIAQLDVKGGAGSL
jgi:hypothetical protein